MNRNRRSDRRWRIAFACLGLLMAGAWLAALGLRGSVRSGDVVGNAFGIAAAAWLAVSAAYGLRRRLMGVATRVGLGGARTWLRLHVYGGLLFLLAVCQHTGFTWPAGLLSWALWLLSLWTVATGLLGWVLQRTVPRLLSSTTAFEVNYERIPDLVAEIRRRAERLAADAEAPVRGLYSRSLAPLLAMPRRDLSVLLDLGASQHHLEPVSRLRELLPVEQGERVAELEDLVRAKLDLDVHYTLQQVLRGWLWLHVPASALLIVLVFLHIATVIYY